MKESYPDEIMLCFVQGFGNSCENGYNKSREIHHEIPDRSPDENIDGLRLSKRRQHAKKVSLQVQNDLEISECVEDVELRSKKSKSLVTGKSLRLSSGDRLLRNLPEVKRSFSDRFSVINDGNGKRPTKGLLTIRKTWSTGNFASGAAGGGCGAPRSASATPLQLEPHPRAKHDKQAVKPLSGSAPSVREPPGAATADGKQPGKSRQKKFQRHFPQVGPEEKVLNYYSCALVGDLLLQGHLYITKNYFAFYSNVFGYVTKLLIPTTSVLRITKEKVARIIPNAVGVCTCDERHVFGSLLSRDATYKLMTHVWKAARAPELAVPKPQELRSSEAELEASEYSPEEDSSSAGDAPRPPARREPDAILSAAGAAVIQPALLTGAPAPRRAARCGRALLLLLALALAGSAALLALRLHWATAHPEWSQLSGEQLVGELLRARARLRGRAAADLQAFLSTNLLLLAKVRQSLEALSGVILTDMANEEPVMDVPNETVFS